MLRERGEQITTKNAAKIKEELCYVCPDIRKEFMRFDREPERFQKYTVDRGRGLTAEIDIGYERFLAPEIFFNPEICSSDFLTPLPNIVDGVIQSAPIDVRRGLYKVCSFASTPCYLILIKFLEHCPFRWFNIVPELWSSSAA
jgi:actin-related protein 3